jgi:D-xylono/L-arabinono-1,4-lactonase
MNSCLSPELVVDYANETGEGPTWHAAEQCLYWTDIPAGRVFRYNPANGRHELVLDGRIVGGMTVQADGSLLLFGEHGAIWTWHDKVTTTIVDVIDSEIGTRFNDVAADPVGRVFCGTMSTTEHPGRLYRLNLDGSLDVILEGVGISNGIGFAVDQKTMYFSESTPKVIHAFDYDIATGNLSNRRQFAVALPSDGTPDGLTVDSDDHVWSARWDGSMIVRYAPDSSIVGRIPFPVPKASSCIFGGEKYRDLYVTTAGGNQKAIDGINAGALYVMRDIGQGKPDYLSRVHAPSR